MTYLVSTNASRKKGLCIKARANEKWYSVKPVSEKEASTMKLLLYAVIFCFLISLITADDDEEEAEGESETESGSDATASKQNGAKAKSQPREPDNKEQSGKNPGEQEGGGEGEEGEEEEKGVKKPKGPKPTTATTTTTTTPEEPEVKGTPPSKPGPSLTKGGKGLRGRCRIQEPNINCVGNSALVMWYFDGETCVPKKSWWMQTEKQATWIFVMRTMCAQVHGYTIYQPENYESV
uniref:Pancreatic trypsin inhibitor n=1 Tax=Rhipicephalus appendiculatus TaxID=34631 RepID=A0A131YSN2_RHIAP